MKKKSKRPYKKPKVLEVKLMPEEAVLSGCKTNTASGKAKVSTGNCTGPCDVSAYGS